MSDISKVLDAVASGDAQAAGHLLPLVYDELRQLAKRQLRQEKPGHSLQATALVHEAYLRLVGKNGAEPSWKSRGHFFGAAAQAMRRILVENARRKKRLKRGGELTRQELDEAQIVAPGPPEDLVALDGALTKLAAQDAAAAQLVQLRYFAGLSIPAAAQAMDISPRTADRLWAYARAWLHQELHNSPSGNKDS